MRRLIHWHGTPAVAPLLALVLIASCGGDDSGTSDTIAEASADGSESGPTTTTTAGTTASTTSSGSAEGSDGTTADATSESSSATGSDGGSGGSGDTGAVACGDAGCEVGMVCVYPCCGGAPPLCEPLPQNGRCPPGSTPVDAGECPFGCDTDTCCQPSACRAPDPYCVAEGELVCGGDPRVADQCSVDDCYGTLVDADLMCTCA